MNDFSESERTGRTIARCVAAVVIVIVLTIPSCNLIANQQILEAMKAGASANAAVCGLSIGGGQQSCALAAAEARK